MNLVLADYLDRRVSLARAGVHLCVTGIPRLVADEAAPHDDIRLPILDRLPSPHHTLGAKPAARRKPLRALVVEMRDELDPHDSMISKGPLSDELERLGSDTPASKPTVKPVERLGSTRREVELYALLTSAPA